MIYDGNIVFPLTCPIRFGPVELSTEITNYPNAFNYIQEFAPSDIIHVQFRHTVSEKTIYVKCTDWYTNKVHSSNLCAFTNMSGIYVYDAWVSLIGLFGFVKLEIYDGSSLIADSIIGYDRYSNSLGKILISDSEDTVSFDYWDSENRHETRFGTFENKNQFRYRVRGGFKPFHFTPKTGLSIFYDQSQSPILTTSIPDSTYKLTLSRMPAYAIATLNYAFACDVVMIGSTQWQAVEDIKEESVLNDMQIPSVVMKTKSNRQFQNIGGDIYITDRYDNVITTENSELFIL